MVSGKIELLISKPMFETFLAICENESIQFSQLASLLKVKNQTLSNRLVVLKKAKLIQEDVAPILKSKDLKGRFYRIDWQKTRYLLGFIPTEIKEEDMKGNEFYKSLFEKGKQIARSRFLRLMSLKKELKQFEISLETFNDVKRAVKMFDFFEEKLLPIYRQVDKNIIEIERQKLGKNPRS